MRILVKFFRLCFSEKCLLIETGCMLAFVRSALLFLPFDVVRRQFRRPWYRFFGAAGLRSHSKQKIAWAIQTVGRHVRRLDHCLTKALVAQLFFHCAGYSATLHIGVSKSGTAFEAHAWVESDGESVIGQEDRAGDWTPILESKEIFS